MSLSKYAAIGFGALAVGAAIMYLSKDSEPIKFDPKLHTIEKLREILDDLYLEYASSYVYYYNIILNMKEANQLSPDVMESIKARLDDITKGNDETVCKKHKISPDFLQTWI